MPIKDYTLFKDLKDKYDLNTFVETGSYMGDGIQMALDARFENIYSIEISEKYYNICKNKFQKYDNVNILKGDSAIMLYDSELHDNINDCRCLFWLDGHYSGGDTGKGKFWSPLIEEIKGINTLNDNNHIILIDDLRCWNKEDVNFNHYNFNENDLKNQILEINKNYRFKKVDGYINDSGRVLKDDILIAYIDE